MNKGLGEGGEERRTVRRFGAWTTDEEVVRFDVTIDEVLLMDDLDTSQLAKERMRTEMRVDRCITRTIWRAAIQTVFMENLRPHISNRSSREGPRRSMTRIL